MSIAIPGIDVSEYQGNIDWAKVKAAGYQFAFVRVGWCGYDGRIVANGGLDKYFRANVEGAIAAGLGVGVYVFSYATSAAASKIAAEETLTLIDGYKLTYPVVFDIEDSSSVNYTGNSEDTNTDIVQAFLEVVEDAGYTPMVYANKAFATNELDWDDLAGYDFWLAQWASKPTYTGDFTVWQHSATGKVDGIVGNVDLNISYKDYAALYEEANSGEENGGDTGEEPDGGDGDSGGSTGGGDGEDNSGGDSGTGAGSGSKNPILALIRWLLSLLGRLFTRK